jgi:hypothetical protein
MPSERATLALSIFVGVILIAVVILAAMLGDVATAIPAELPRSATLR